MRKIFLVLFLALVSPTFADFNIQLDAGELRLNANQPMPLGSLLVLVAAGGDGSFSNSLSAGQYVSGNDILLSVVSVPFSAAGFNMNGGTNETLNLFKIDTDSLPPLTTGDLIALRWFPQISLTQFQAGATPSSGQNFGTYNPLLAGNGTNNPDEDDPWAVPDGGQIKLNFFTIDSDGSGTQDPATGFASLTVIPEPSSITLLGIAAAAAAAFRQLRRRRA